MHRKKNGARPAPASSHRLAKYHLERRRWCFFFIFKHFLLDFFSLRSHWVSLSLSLCSSLVSSTLNRFKIHYNIFRISSAQSPFRSLPSALARMCIHFIECVPCLVDSVGKRARATPDTLHYIIAISPRCCISRFLRCEEFARAKNECESQR